MSVCDGSRVSAVMVREDHHPRDRADFCKKVVDSVGIERVNHPHLIISRLIPGDERVTRPL